MIDLHSHSTRSDGSETPAAIVELAAGVGLSAIALTDHDGLDGIAEAKRTGAALGVEVVAGCEVSCAFSPGSMHMLCYFIEPGSGPLAGELERLREDRIGRNVRLVERLNELGLSISYEEVVAEAKGSTIGRPHFAAVLVKRGAVSDIDQAFRRYLAKGTPGYVAKARVLGTEVVEQATASGGVATLAHPLSLGLAPDDLAQAIAPLADAGMAGLECYYGNYDDDTRQSLARLADRFGLVATGGSDFHGTYKPALRIGVGRGDLSVPDEVLQNLNARRPAPTLRTS